MKDPAMGYIVAVLGRKGQDVTNNLKRMLRATGGPEAPLYGVASPETGEFFDRPSKAIPSMGSSLIAYKSSSFEASPLQPSLQRSGAMVFDGLILSAVEPDILHVAELLRDRVAEGMWKLVSDVDGAFSAVAIDGERIFLVRDAVGTVPLYHGVND
jgi:hypothetical protein